MALNFIHLTDLHLSHPDLNDPGLWSDTVANLRLMVTQLRQMTPQPHFVVASGDLTNHGDETSYQMVRDILQGAGIPIVYALGNHDKRAAFRAVFPGVADNSTADAPVYHQSIHGELQVIALDSSRPGRVSGAICDEQFAFLEGSLRAAPEVAKLLIIHHPPLIGDSSLAWESLSQNDTDRLADTLRGHNIAAMLSGHVHFNRVSHWHGIPIIVCNGLHATVDVLRPAGMQIREGTGFGYCTWQPSGITVSFVPLTPARNVLGEISDDLLGSFH
jgi:Icc protein